MRQITACFLGLFLIALDVNAEAFGNNSLTIPKIGVSFFDGPLVFQKKPWGLTYQWTVGTSYMQAISYRFWWVAETSMSFGRLDKDAKPYIGAFSGGAGLRYNFLEGNFRPFACGTLNYLHFLGDGVKSMPLNLGWPIFVGLRPTIGLEWLFYSEMALSLDASYGLYVNINEPFRQIIHTNFSFAFYF